MNKKFGLVTIGELSRLSSVGIKSIRYYERINILKPAYVDPDTKYRYYSFHQVFQVSIIRACIELSIPLKELTNFVEAGDKINLRALIECGKEITNKKLRSIEKAFAMLNSMEQQINMADAQSLGEIYCREFREKYFYMKLCERDINEIDLFEDARVFADIINELGLTDDDYNDISEYGLIRKYGQNEDTYYSFIELPRKDLFENTITIPAGTYFCRQDKDSRIEHIHELFKEQLAGRDSFIAIETEIFTGTTDISRPINELRLLIPLKSTRGIV